MNTAREISKSQSKREIFAAALTYSDPGERRIFLDRACGGNSPLRDAIETLLGDHSSLGNFLEPPATKARGFPEVKIDDLTGTSLGPYTLIRMIGEGAGGSIYLARQTTPVERNVALKILKIGLNTSNVISRFEAERQTLARMEHPHIARVIDAGSTEQGRPFFIMEYVAGDPVTDFCDIHLLPIKRRLEIFIRICRAIEHAHQKSVIHRDIKPSNILVIEQEDRPLPKVIDFGVAKAIDPLKGEDSGLTIQDLIIGTPAYMSPEQADLGNQDIDTRADIYSLGVILFELLTGTTPLHAMLPKGAGTATALKLLRNSEPPRPSTHLKSCSALEIKKIAKNRSQSPGQLIHEVGGDLDWIVMKCLEKNRARRFGSASELARDLELYLDGAPIMARAPSWNYRMGKFVNRNRFAVFFSSFLLASLLAFVFVSFAFALRAKEAEATQSDLREQAEDEREQAIQNADEAHLRRYVANINLAHQAVLNGNLSNARLLLEPWTLIEAGESDPRGFEWYYLMEQCRGDPHFALPQFGSPIDSLDFSPEGTRLAIATSGQIHIWSTEESRITSSFPIDAHSIKFSNTGEMLIAEGREGVFVLDLISEITVWGQRGNHLGIALAPNGQTMAVSDRRGTTIWETANWNRIDFISGATGSLAYSPNGESMASASRDGVKIWSISGNKKSILLEDSPRFFFGRHNFHFSNHGKQLVLARNNDPATAGYVVSVYDTDTGLEVGSVPRGLDRELHTGVISSMCFSNDDTTLVTSSWDHSVRLWNLNDGSLLRSLLGHGGEVWSVDFSPDGTLVASGSKDGEVRIWPTKKGSDLSTIEGPWKPLTFRPDGTSITAVNQSGVVSKIQLSTGQEIETLKVPTSSSGRTGRYSISVDHQSQIIAEIKSGGMISLTNFKRESTTKFETGWKQVDSVLLSPDGKSLVAFSRDKRLAWWNLEKPQEAPFRNTATFGLFSADSSTLVLRDGRFLSVFDTLTRQQRHRFPFEKSALGSSLSLSQDGEIIAFTHGFKDFKNVISLVESNSGRSIGSLKGHKQAIWSLAFSPDGKTLASSGSGGVVRLWNLATQSELLSIGRSGKIRSNLLFSPDGRVLISSSPGFSSKPQIQIIRGLRDN